MRTICFSCDENFPIQELTYLQLDDDTDPCNFCHDCLVGMILAYRETLGEENELEVEWDFNLEDDEDIL